MKKVLFPILALMLLLLAACGGQDSKTEGSDAEASSDSANEETIDLNLGHTLSESHILHKGSVKFAELAKEKTDGRINFTIYASGQLGNDVELIESVMSGNLDAFVSGVPFFSGFTPVLDSYLLPFLIDNYALEREVLDAPITREMLDSLGDLGLVGLSMFEGGLVHIGNTEHEITSPEDMSGLRIRTGTSDLAVDSLVAQGASPTPMVLPEVYSGLQTNVIDGVQTNLVTIASEKLYEVLNYITIHGQYSFPAVATINKDVFEGLSKEDQEALLEAAKEAGEFTLSEIEKLDEEAKQEIEQAGVEIIDLTEEEKQVFIDATQGIYDDYMSKDPLIEKFVNTVRDMK